MKVVRDGIELEQLHNDTTTVTFSGSYANPVHNIAFQGAGVSGSGRGLVLSDIHEVVVTNCSFNGFPSWAMATGRSRWSFTACVSENAGVLTGRSPDRASATAE